MPNNEAQKAKVYQLFVDMFLKLLFGVGSFIAFCVVLAYLINAKTTFDAVKLGAIEAFLAGTVYVVFAHLFPTKAKVK